MKAHLLSGSIIFYLLLTGCASSPTAESLEPKSLDLTLVAERNVNTNEAGQPAPILVKIYELKNNAAFEEADFISLQKSDKSLLKEDLITKNETVLKPGAQYKIARTTAAEAQYIGIIAEYRELGKATWRMSYKLPDTSQKPWYHWFMPHKRAQIKVLLERNDIKIEEIKVSQ